MRIAICDDNKDELSLISSLLDTYQQERNTSIFYKIFDSATKLLAAAKSGTYDLYLLDVTMPAINGLEAAREIRTFDKVSHIIFLTATPEIAVTGDSIKADHYLQKPVRHENLFFVLDDIKENVDRQNQPAVVVKSSDGIQKLLLSQLTHVEATDLSNMHYIDAIKNTEILLQTGNSLAIAQRRTAEIKESYLAFQMEAHEWI